MKKVNFYELLKLAEAKHQGGGMELPTPVAISGDGSCTSNAASVPPTTPASEPDEPDEVEDRWQPYKPHKKKCPPDKHWPMIGKCQKCGDIFPCPSGNCGHIDCADPSVAGLDCPGNGTALPEFINVIPGGTDPMARAECGTIEIREESAD